MRLTERRLTDLPEWAQQRSSLDENCDGSLLTFAYQLGEDHFIGFYDLAGATLLPAARLDFKPDHLQFHRHRPDIISVSRTYEAGGDWAPLDPIDPHRARIWTLNVHTRQPIPAFYQVPGELATHECWWVNDQMTFVGGFHHEGEREEGTVKVLDFKTGEIRIIGAGAWLEGVPGAQLSQVNWWHAAARMASIMRVCALQRRGLPSMQGQRIAVYNRPPGFQRKNLALFPIPRQFLSLGNRCSRKLRTRTCSARKPSADKNSERVLKSGSRPLPKRAQPRVAKR